MDLSNLPDKLIIDDRKYLIFLEDLKQEGYIVISYETYILDFINRLFDAVCINNDICKKCRGDLIQYQISEITSILNNYFGKHCIETSLISKNINKKIVIYDINYEDVKEFFMRYNFEEFGI